MRFRHGAMFVCAVAMVCAGACGGSPTAPPPPPPPPPANGAPVIDGITVEPARLEIGEQATLTASVRDAETPVSQLTFQWSAPAGTVNGQGTTVAWQAPPSLDAPQDFTVRLTVVERYSGTLEHRVAQDAGPIRVHDSPGELGRMTVTFLNDFANSSIPAETVMRDFSDGCPGKAEELADVRDNRQHYQNLGSQIGTPRVTLNSSRTRADISVSCEFTSFARSCPADEPSCIPNTVGTARGQCILTGVYEQRRWWLCSSNFGGPNGGRMRWIFGGQ